MPRNSLFLVTTIAIILSATTTVVFTPRFLDFLDSRRKERAGSLQTPAPENYHDYLNAGPPTIVLPQETADGPVIRYTNEGFAPQELTASQTDSGVGCFLTVTNESDKALIIRLSPHEKAAKGNYGFAYDPILPGESAIIDPRYGRGEESFHNFNHPSREFVVRFDPSCIGN